MWWDGSGYGFHWMWIFPLLFLLVFALFVFWGRGWPMCGGHGRHDREESAPEILDRRYARGEIGREEYQRMRKDLERLRTQSFVDVPEAGRKEGARQVADKAIATLNIGLVR